MKLSEYKNEQAIELLADIIEPLGEILSDAELKNAFKAKVKLTKFAKIILKKHKSEVVEILAALDGKEVEDYECDIVSVPMKLLEILNDPMLLDFFASQPKTKHEQSSGAVMEVTTENEQ